MTTDSRRKKLSFFIRIVSGKHSYSLNENENDLGIGFHIPSMVTYLCIKV